MRSGMESGAPGYDPARLVDQLQARLGVPNDAQLARRLGVLAPTISKIRHGRQAVTSAFLVYVHEATALSLAELRSMLGDRRGRWRPAPQGGRKR